MIWIRLGLLLSVWFVLASITFMPIIESASAAQVPNAQLEPSHHKMLETLKRIAEWTEEENPYLGNYRVRQLREQLANLGEGASAHTRWILHLEAGQAELNMGHLQASIEQFSQAYQLVPKAQVDTLNLTAFRLGVAYMRLGETQNCCLRHTPQSCIVPIQSGGLHTELEGSSKAIEYFREVLNNSPQDTHLHLKARWLLNIAYMTIGGYPDDVPEGYLIPPTAFESNLDFPRFTNIAPKLGLDTFNLSGGVIVDDFDNDDYLDIVTSTWDTTGQMRFFRNNRDGTFSDQTLQAGLLGLYGGLNLEQADYNNDGNLDILVLRGAWIRIMGQHPNSLLRNNGDGTFTDVTFEAGLAEVHYPTQTGAWADYDNDGDLDLYIGNETTPDITAPCQLFRNNGNGTFTDIAFDAGVAHYGFTKGVGWGDFDGDRFPDLYLSNYGANRLYHNNGDGTFTDVAPQLGVTRPNMSFPVWFWDFDNDGVVDLFVSSYTGTVENVSAYHVGVPAKFELPSLYLGDGRGGFEDVATEQGLTYPMLAMGSNFGDLNNDGYLDFYLGTGDTSYESLVPNLMFLNRAGKRFVNVTMAGGFGHLQKGHGIAFADLDNDGDADVFEQMGGAYPGDKFSNVLYENPGFDNHFITIKLVGVESNRSAIGARIHLQIIEDGKKRSIYRHVNSGGSFGANPLRQTIGLGRASKIERLEVLWPTTGLTQTFHNVDVDQFIQIVEGEEQYTTLTLKKLKLGEKRLKK